MAVSSAARLAARDLRLIVDRCLPVPWAMEEALQAGREAGDRLRTGSVLNNLGEVARARGDLAGARALYEQTLAISRELGDLIAVDTQLSNLGHVARAQGDAQTAMRFYIEQLEVSRALGKKEGVASGLEGLGAVHWVERDPARAARLFGAAEAVREAIGHPLESTDRPLHQRAVASLRAGLEAEALARGWAAGRAMPLDAAVEEAFPERTAREGGRPNVSPPS